MLSELLRRIAFLMNRRKRLAEMDEEMRLHTDLRARNLQDVTASRADAVAEAQRRFGNRTSFKEAVWDVWSFVSLENAWRDLKFGARVLRSRPSFTVLAVLILGLGIGATTAMFSVIDNVLLEPFPYAHQQRLFSLVIHDKASSEPGGRTMFPAAEFLDYEQQNRVFEGVMGVAINRALWSTAGEPESVNAPLVTPNAFEFLGVPPALGRLPSLSDLAPGNVPVCVMSYSFWQSRFAKDPRILGETLILDGTPRSVIGVMPPRFVFWSGDVWIPVILPVGQAGFPPPWFYMLGRLKAGISPANAERQMQGLAQRFALKYRPDLYPKTFDVTLQSFADASVGRFRNTLFTLLAAVGLLLLIACTNVANLLLARVSSRKKELAVRASLGAGWWRIVRQLFLECCVLAFVGACLGCGFAWGGLKVLMLVLPRDTFPDEAVISLNVRVLLGAIVVAVGTALFFGLIPVFGGLRQDLSEALRSGGREHSGFRRSRIRNLLVVCEVAISLVLLSAAGVMMRSFIRQHQVQLGVMPDHLLTAEIYLTKGHRTLEQQARFNRELTTALRRVPGVVDVATSTDFLPFGGAPTQFEISGRTQSGQASGQFAMIDPSLFRTLRVPLLRGRNLNEIDAADKRMAALVNHAFVEKYFAGKDPLGQNIELTTLAQLPQPVAHPWFEIVGVTGDFKNRGLRQPVMPEAFIPYTISGFGGFTVIARTAGNPEALGRTLEGTALRLDSNTVVRHIRSMQEAVEAEVYAKPRFGVQIISVFAAIGLVLASAGLYAATLYTVSQRRREIGIRLALGATNGEVRAFIVRTEMRFVAAGVVAGLLASYALLRFIQSQLWGVSTHDPLTLGGVVLTLIVVATAACYLPTLATTRIDPAETLRSE